MRRAGYRRHLKVSMGAALTSVTVLMSAAEVPARTVDMRIDSVVVATSGSDVAPNVLVINLDDATELMLDWRYPNGTWVLPHVQSFKAKATVFSNTFVDIPSCCPSRFSLFTGRYPHNTGGKLQEDGVDLPRRETFVHWLRTAGYTTAMAGKFLVPWPLSSAPPSYDRYTFLKGGYYDPTVNRNGDVSTVKGYSTNVLAGDLTAYLNEFEAEDLVPWFAYWAPQAPHVNGGFKSLAVPADRDAAVDMGTCVQPGESNRDDKPPYVRFVAPDRAYTQDLCTSQLRALIAVDRRFGKLRDRLRERGEFRDTMVVLTSDNGYHWGEQGWFSKFYPYEPSIGIPLYIKWPASMGIPPGEDTRLASSLDLTATILDVAGVSPTTTLDGRSLLQPGVRTEVFAEYFQDPDNGDMGTWAMLRSADSKYIESSQVSSSGAVTNFVEYYDLLGDPDESDNVLHDTLIGNEPSAAVLSALSDRLQAARTCAGDACP